MEIHENLLDLSDHKLKNLDPSLFANHVGVETLYLQYNLITILLNNAFESLPSLKHINASHNKIQTVQKSTFYSLTNTQYLRGLTTLDLSYNLIRSLDIVQFQKLPVLKHLYLGENPWYCDCKLEPLAIWLKHSRIEDDPRTVLSPVGRGSMMCGIDSVFILKDGVAYPFKLDMFLGIDASHVTDMEVYNFTALDVGSLYLPAFCERFRADKEYKKYRLIIGIGIPSILVMWALTAYFVAQILRFQRKGVGDIGDGTHDYEKESGILAEALKSAVIPDYNPRFNYLTYEREAQTIPPKHLPPFNLQPKHDDKDSAIGRIMSGSGMNILGKVIGDNFDYFMPYIGGGEDREHATPRKGESLPSVSLPKMAAVYERGLKERLFKYLESIMHNDNDGLRDSYEKLIDNIFRDQLSNGKETAGQRQNSQRKSLGLESDDIYQRPYYLKDYEAQTEPAKASTKLGSLDNSSSGHRGSKFNIELKDKSDKKDIRKVSVHKVFKKEEAKDINKNETSVGTDVQQQVPVRVMPQEIEVESSDAAELLVEKTMETKGGENDEDSDSSSDEE